MILADKIINERKKNGWSQEELAEMLEVSRQSVSKWESAQSTPDMARIVKMSEIFGVSTDYLLKDELEPEKSKEMKEDAVSSKGVRQISMEEANRFMKLEERIAPKLANAVSLCILSPVILLTLLGFVEDKYISLSEDSASGIGVIAVLFFVAAAVFVFVRIGLETKEYEFLEKELIETAYGVDGMVKAKKEAFAAKRTTYISIGVVMCILSPVPLLVSAFIDADGGMAILMVAILLVIVAVAVNIFVRVETIQGSYNKLLQVEEYSEKGKESSGITGKIASIYWPIVVAIFLGYSFLTNNWGYSWIIWPVAGVLFGAIAAFISCFVKNKE